MSKNMAIRVWNCSNCPGLTVQHDIFANPVARDRSAYPFIVNLQSDLVESTGRMVAPMLPRAVFPGAAGRLMPIVRHDGAEFMIALELMVSVPTSRLRDPVGSVAQHRHEITRALDWLFTGV
jgi:toxin CcdB